MPRVQEVFCQGCGISLGRWLADKEGRSEAPPSCMFCKHAQIVTHTEKISKKKKSRFSVPEGTCSTCLLAKPEEEMHAKRKCRLCQALYMKDYYARHPEKWEEYARKQNEKRNHLTILLDCGVWISEWREDKWWKTYRVTKEMFSDQWIYQGGRCPISHKLFSQKRFPDIDHNHETGRFRGLLLGKANRGLGLFDEDPAQMSRGEKYILSDGCRPPDQPNPGLPVSVAGDYSLPTLIQQIGVALHGSQ